jgi:hypothetical protein
MSGNLVEGTQEFKGVGHGEVPPELCPLAKDDSDMPDVLLTLRKRLTAIDINSAGIRFQNAAQNLDQRRLASAIWADTTHEGTLGDLKRDIAKRINRRRFPIENGSHGLPIAARDSIDIYPGLGR